jgi:hypothetical protein
LRFQRATYVAPQQLFRRFQGMEISVIKSREFITTAIALLIAITARATTPEAPGLSGPNGATPDVISQIAAHFIAAEIPREYERKKDWGKTKEITTGLHSNGNFFKFDIHRETSEVNHGIWKQYRLTLIDPDKNLDVQIENLHPLESGRLALTLNIASKVHGWARTTVYDRGVHIIGLEAEGDTGVKLSLDTEVGLTPGKTDSFLPSYAIDPAVKDARIKFEDFKLTRISDLRGPLAHEIGIVLREAVEEELKGPKLTNKINLAIDKHRDRLQLTPEMLLGKLEPKKKSGSKPGGAN